MNQALKKPKPSAVRQVRAVGVCRPPGPWDSRRYSSSAAAASEALTELNISDPATSGELPADAPDAGLCRDIAVGADTVLCMPLYGHRGAAAELLCEQEVAPLLRRLLSGESAAVIAYGQTGSGKSHTMGTEKCEEGSSPARHSVSAFCAEGMFALARECGVKELEVSLAAVEIYREGQNERLFDLQTLERKRIASFEQQASWQRAASAQDLQRKLQEAAFLRSTDRSDGNARSSRFHAIFVTQARAVWDGVAGACEGSSSSANANRAAAGGSVAASGGGGGATGGDGAGGSGGGDGAGGSGGGGGGGGWQRIKARLMLVDLAGSERALLAQPGSSSQKQGSGINVGLLLLGMVINELAERGETKNYAFSCLTKILKPALGGGSNEVTSSCNTLILGCLDPLALHLANTRSTLEFLQSAGTIKNVVRADVQMLRQQELAAEVEDLRRQLCGMQLQLSRHPHLQLAGSGGGSDTAAAAGAAAGRDFGSIGLVAQAGQGSASAGGGGGDAAVIAAAATAAAAAAVAGDERVAALEAQLAASRAEAASLRMSLVVERGRAEAYEAVLRQQESGTAATAVAAAGGEAAAANAALGEGARVTAASAGVAGETPGTAGMQLGAAGTATTTGAAAAAAATPTPSAAARPFAALMAASPLLAASRDVAEQPVIVSRPWPLLRPASTPSSPTTAAWGAAVTRAEDAAEDLQAAVQQQEAEFMQLYQEKVQYMRHTAAAEIGLAEYETQVERLQARLAAAHKALEKQAEAQQGTPGRWGSIGRLLSGSSRSPAAAGGPAASPGGGEMAAGGAGGAGGGSLRSSSSGCSPDGTPRGGIVGGGSRPQQQQFGSPSPLAKQQQKWQQGRQQPELKQQQQHRQLQDQQQQGQQQQGQQQEDQQQQQQQSDQEQQQSDQLEDQPLQDQQQQDEQAQQAERQAPAAANQAGLLLEAGRPGNLSNLTVASLRLSLEQQEQAHAAAAASFLAAKQRQAAAALAGSGSGGEQAEALLIKAAGRHSGTAGLPPAAPEEQLLSAQLPCKPLPGLGLPTQQQQQQQQQEQEQMQQEGEQVGLTAQPTAALQQAVEQGAAEREVSGLQEREGVGARAVRGHAQAIDTQRAQQAQQPQQQVQAQQAEQLPAVLPGPGVAVMVPMPGSGGGKARVRARKAAAYQEFDLCPATDTFTLPGSDEAADPLTALRKVCV
ncbi:hypothetical protein D9Q98_003626 [Chlorella vulgaris]|uniref:Kinesin motor domain-containing protein n=1 Tax=Chlorella vulgaris TaxID=3077 RepID=A0A9D4TT66_CHLVU|nr:hypothetical protein D9Q98_003626 [Chlorella vulgaris]